MKILLKRGASPKDKAPSGVPLLGDALLYDENDFELSRLLLSYGADMNDLSYPDPDSPRTTAIMSVLHAPEKLRFALEHGANPDVYIGDAQSLLESICNSFWGASETPMYPENTPRIPTSTWLESARLLLETKRVSLQGRPGQTLPLEYAVYAESPEMLKLLLEFGANPNEKNGRIKTPLDIARERGKIEMIALMEAALVRKPVVH